MRSAIASIALLPGFLSAEALFQPLDNIGQMEERLEQVDAELDSLAHLSFRSDTGSIGYRSQSYYSKGHAEWVQIDLSEIQTFDEVVIVPVIRRDPRTQFVADGLPDKMIIKTGMTGDPEGHVIATVAVNEPRTAPLVIPMEKTKATWIRIEAPTLNKRGFDGRYTFHLAEIMVFSDEENIALHRPVTTSTASTGHSDAWNPRFLVDGHTPYIMDTAKGKKTNAFIALGAQPPAVIIDLGQPQDISRLHLHAVDQSSMVPQAHFSDYGLPRHLTIEGSLKADFSDASLLVNMHRASSVEAGTIMMWRFPETRCRYVRILSPKGETGLNIPPIHFGVLRNMLADELPSLDKDSPLFRVGFAEIELFAHGRNVALNKRVTTTNLPNKVQGEIAALTDGSNFYGQIIPVREWMHQLARRHELEQERPLIEAMINNRLSKQRDRLNRMYWISGIMALVIIAGLVLARLIHLHHLRNIKKRIAADLHDELGANLHAIGLFGDLAKMEVPAVGNEQLVQNLDEIRNLTEMTATSTRYISHMLDADSYHDNVIPEMKHTATRFLTDLHHECSFPPDGSLAHLAPRKRIDLYLFYKECLTNIIRHSGGASKVTTRLEINGNKLILTVQDNGIGLNGKTPPSIKRRAQLMRGKLEISQPSGGGTSISLQLRIRSTS